MRHPKRIIRRLRRERDRLVQENHSNEKIYHSLVCNVGQYLGNVGPTEALRYVQYVEQKNRNQADMIRSLEDDVAALDVEIDDIRRANALNLALLLLVAIGSMAFAFIYVSLNTVAP